MIQYALNTVTHKGNKECPFVAVFGRDPHKLPELENPSPFLPKQTGTEFVRGLRERLQKISKVLHDESEEIRAFRYAKMVAAAKVTPLEIKIGDIVWLHVGNYDAARRMRKSGKGEPWRYQYKVLALCDFSVKIEPVGDAPRLQDWQPLHKVSLSPPEFHDNDYEIFTDNWGLPFAPGKRPQIPTSRNVDDPLGPPEKEGKPRNDDGYYEIDRIIGAYRRGRRWYIRVKWGGWQEPTDEPKTRLINGPPPLAPEFRNQVHQACARAMSQGGSTTV